MSVECKYCQHRIEHWKFGTKKICMSCEKEWDEAAKEDAEESRAESRRERDNTEHRMLNRLNERCDIRIATRLKVF